MHIRKATPADVPEIERIMRESLETIGRQSYDEGQIAGALLFIARPDPQLIEDGTYFVVEIDGKLAACGGWSKRGKLYAGSAASGGEERLLDPAAEPARVRAMFTRPEFARRGLGRLILQTCEHAARDAGFTRVDLMAMRSGEAMYAACGYVPVEQTTIVLEDGTTLPTTHMTREIG